MDVHAADQAAPAGDADIAQNAAIALAFGR